MQPVFPTTRAAPSRASSSTTTGFPLGTFSPTSTTNATSRPDTIARHPAQNNQGSTLQVAVGDSDIQKRDSLLHSQRTFASSFARGYATFKQVATYFDQGIYTLSTLLEMENKLREDDFSYLAVEYPQLEQKWRSVAIDYQHKLSALISFMHVKELERQFTELECVGSSTVFQTKLAEAQGYFQTYLKHRNHETNTLFQQAWSKLEVFADPEYFDSAAINKIIKKTKEYLPKDQDYLKREMKDFCSKVLESFALEDQIFTQLSKSRISSTSSQLPINESGITATNKKQYPMQPASLNSTILASSSKTLPPAAATTVSGSNNVFGLAPLAKVVSYVKDAATNKAIEVALPKLNKVLFASTKWNDNAQQVISIFKTFRSNFRLVRDNLIRENHLCGKSEEISERLHQFRSKLFFVYPHIDNVHLTKEQRFALIKEHIDKDFARLDENARNDLIEVLFHLYQLGNIRSYNIQGAGPEPMPIDGVGRANIYKLRDDTILIELPETCRKYIELDEIFKKYENDEAGIVQNTASWLGTDMPRVPFLECDLDKNNITETEFTILRQSPRFSSLMEAFKAKKDILTICKLTKEWMLTDLSQFEKRTADCFIKQAAQAFCLLLRQQHPNSAARQAIENFINDFEAIDLQEKPQEAFIATLDHFMEFASVSKVDL